MTRALSFLNDWFRVTRWFLIVTLAVIGLRMALPPPTFTLGPAWDAMEQIAPEEIWGWGFVLLGILCGMMEWSGGRRLRVWALGCLASAHAVTGALTMMSAPSAVVPWTLTMIGVLALLAAMKASADA